MEEIKICTKEECKNRSEAKGLCTTHYLAAWHLKNKARRLANNKNWYQANKEKHRTRPSLISPEARKRKSERQKLRRQANPLTYRGLNLKSRYGITLQDYDRMLAAQKGCCSICKSSTPRSASAKNFAVDHDHKTGKVRGLLCHPCNWSLGYFEDKTENLVAAITYLREHSV